MKTPKQVATVLRAPSSYRFPPWVIEMARVHAAEKFPGLDISTAKAIADMVRVAGEHLGYDVRVDKPE